MNKEAMERIKNLSFKKRLRLIKVFRNMYNDMCSSCKQLQGSNIQKGISPDYENLCEICQEKSKKQEEELNKILE